MGKFMQWLRQELEGIKMEEIKPPDREVDDGEEVLGILTDLDLQKLWVLRGRLNGQVLALVKEHDQKKIELAGVESESDHNPATCEFCVIIRNLAILCDKNSAVDALFWTSLRHELSEEALVRLHEADGPIGIRKDWKIVACHGSKSSPLVALPAFVRPILISI